MLEHTPKLPLIHALLDYGKQPMHRFHVPAHAGRAFWPDPLADYAKQLGLSETLLLHDCTEVDGLDVLSTPTGVIAESQALAAKRCGARESFYLINGSSGGLHAAMLAGLSSGSDILVPRNAHRSVMAAMILGDTRPTWVYPMWEADWGIWGALTVKQLEQGYVQNPNVKALVVTSPTYEGILSPITEIAQWCQAKDMLLIVDEAHGALLGHTAGLPESSITIQGVDAVIQSLHKTAGALTQGAILHLPHGSRLNANRVQETLNHLQTTSPSYPLLASLELATAWLNSEAGQAQRQTLWRNVKPLRERINALSGLRLMNADDIVGGSIDPLRITLRHAYLDGEIWADQLESSHQLAYELANSVSATYIAQIGHRSQDVVALFQGLTQLNKDHSIHGFTGETFDSQPLPPLPPVQCVMTPRAAFFASQEAVSLSDVVGRCAAQTVVSCPPGIPVLQPGEQIQEGHIALLTSYASILCAR